MFGGWKASLLTRRSKEKVVCPVCGNRNAREHAWYSLRCRKCGARRPLDAESAERK
jgi:ribosomal protein L40E